MADAPADRVPTIAEKRAFLESGRAWPGEPPPLCLETHASFVFLTLNRAYKLKKPVRLPHADMQSLAARRHLCVEEFSLNRELAGDVYRRVVPLTLGADGALAIGGEGRPVDWLVEMERLPASEMLDSRIVEGPPPQPAEIDAVGARLVAFYAGRKGASADGPVYHARLSRELATDIEHLHEMSHRLDSIQIGDASAHVPALLKAARTEIEGRAAAGLVVEGHGDLRAEHVCLTRPPVLFDRLEFGRTFRLIDPHAEVGALDLDCIKLGADWIGPALHKQLVTAGIPLPAPGLLSLYRVLRCLTQARLAIDHLRDPHPRTPEKWAPRARWFIAKAASLRD